MSYASTILADSPTAFYQMHETGGTTAADSTSNAYNGSLAGTITLNQAALLPALGPCFKFDGSSGHITLPSAARQQNPCSWEVWLSMPATLQNSQFFSAGLVAIEFGLDHTGGDKFFAAGNSGNYDPSGALTTTAGTIYYAVMTVDSSMNFAGYYAKSTDSDVTAFSSANPGGSSINYGSQVLWIGADDSGSEYWNNYLSNLAIYPAVLSHAQAKAHFLAGIATGGPPASTIPAIVTQVKFRDGETSVKFRDGETKATFRDGLVQVGGR